MRSPPRARYANEAQWKYMGDGGRLQYNYSTTVRERLKDSQRIVSVPKEQTDLTVTKDVIMHEVGLKKRVPTAIPNRLFKGRPASECQSEALRICWIRSCAIRLGN